MKKTLSLLLVFILLCTSLLSCNKQEKYDEYIEFPAYALDGSFSTSVSHLKYYPSHQAYADYSTVEITDYRYSYSDSIKNTLTINFDFECYIYYLYEGETEFSFEIVAYSVDGIRVSTAHVRGEGEVDETVRIEGTININMDDVKEGIVIEFCDHKD